MQLLRHGSTVEAKVVVLLEVLVREQYFGLSNFFVVGDGVVGLAEHKKTIGTIVWFLVNRIYSLPLL